MKNTHLSAPGIAAIALAAASIVTGNFWSSGTPMAFGAVPSKQGRPGNSLSKSRRKAKERRKAQQRTRRSV